MKVTSDNFQKHNYGINQGRSSLFHRFEKNPCLPASVSIRLAGIYATIMPLKQHQAPGLHTISAPSHILQERKKLFKEVSFFFLAQMPDGGMILSALWIPLL